jgi:hypothetical protein
MDFLSITLSNLVWIIYSMTEGLRESFFSFYKEQNKKVCLLNTKRIFSAQRYLVLSLITLIMLKTIGLISIPIALGQIFMFRYFHKLSYDITKNKLNINQKENKEIDPILKKNKYLLIFGISIQIITYSII